MAKKCQVRPLGDHAIGELANSIVSAIGNTIQNQLESEIAIVMVEINSYLEDSGATSDIYQDLIRVILSSDYLEANIRFNCLQMLLNVSVQALVTEIFPFSYYEKILQVIAAQGAGLRSLNLKGVWIKEEHMDYMFDIVRKCKHLTRLSVPYIANDDLLKSIAEHCAELRVLDVSGETDITEIGVECLCLGLAKGTLTIVDIGTLGEENICHEDIALLLTNLPNLESLVTYSFVGRSLQYIHDHHNSNYKTKLKYLHDTNTDADRMNIIVKMCPELDSLYIDTPVNGVMLKLVNLNLRRLKVYKFCCDELCYMLDTIGRNLVHLTLIKGRGTLDMGKLARKCTALINLDCYMMDLLTFSTETQFNGLQGLELLNSPFTTSSLKNFLIHTPTLKRLAVDSIAFTDEDIANIFLAHDFKYLEDIWFTSAPNLSVDSVEILMEKCPELQSIGQLSGWALTPDDVVLLRGLLKSGNSCLVLSPSSIFP